MSREKMHEKQNITIIRNPMSDSFVLIFFFYPLLPFALKLLTVQKITKKFVKKSKIPLDKRGILLYDNAVREKGYKSVP